MVPPARGWGWQTTAAATAELGSRRIASSCPCPTGMTTRPEGEGADIAPGYIVAQELKRTMAASRVPDLNDTSTRDSAPLPAAAAPQRRRGLPRPPERAESRVPKNP